MYAEIISNVKMLEVLLERETHWVREKINRWKKRKIVVFASGATGAAAYDTLVNQFGVEPEFFIDNDIKKEGKFVCGKPIVLEPWKSYSKFTEEYAVLIATGWKYAHQIEAQLSEVGATEYLHFWSFRIALDFERYKAVAKMVNDELSVLSYYGALFNMLTDNRDFILTNSEHYFAVRNFKYYETGSIIVDAGSFNGAEIEEYMKRSYGSAVVYAFEPSADMTETLNHNKKILKKKYNLRDDQIVIVPFGLGENAIERMFFSQNYGGIGVVANEIGDNAIKVTTLDEYFSDKQHFDVLKADIESMELPMLKGGAKTIEKYRPMLAISIYHSVDEFVTIAEYLHAIVPSYKFAVRNHSYNYTDTVLYAWEE
jgi:FkbM family methyltransferase